MNDFLASAAIIVALTLSLVSALRKLWPKLDGKWLVFGCAMLVGVSLSVAETLLALTLYGVAMAPWGALIARGAVAASVAFGYANWRSWVMAQLPTVPDAITLKGTLSETRSTTITTTEQKP